MRDVVAYVRDHEATEAAALDRVMRFVWREYPPDIPTDATAWAHLMGATSSTAFHDAAFDKPATRWTFSDGSAANILCDGSAVTIPEERRETP
jgi:hypothetical protein